MKQSLDQFTKPLATVIKQYHTTIMLVLLAILVGLAIFRLSMIVSLSSEKGVDGYTPISKTTVSFDQKTINRIENLHTTTESGTPLQFPARPNPFVE